MSTMETESIALQTQSSTTSEMKKEKKAVTAFRVNFASHCQKIMIKADIPSSEWTVNCSTYLEFVNMALLSSFEKLRSLKSKSSYGITEEENVFLNALTAECGSNEDEKLELALKYFNESLTPYLQQTMLNAQYEASEVDENHSLFVSFFSKVWLIEADKLIRFKEGFEAQLSKNRINEKKTTIDGCLATEKTESSFKGTASPTNSIKKVKSTSRYDIYCLSTPDGLRALKTPKNDNPTVEDIKNLENEIKIGSQIDYYAFRKSCGKTEYQNQKASLLEWVEGIPLNEVENLNTETFFRVAREIISCLLEMHNNEICHLNLTSDHIIFDSKSNSIKLIGCGSSSPFCSKRSYNPNLSNRDLRYISPEQTGMINKDIDFRSDFYSLGIILYRLLIGRYPFDSPAAINMIKMHVFQEPTPLHEIDSSISLPVSNMISRLMEKNAELRYQSAKGVMHDIELIMSEYKPGAELVLGQHDMPKTLILPQKIYGRCHESCLLHSAYYRIVSSSSFELVFVQGNSGSGKSALAMELQELVVKKGIFIYGKYDCSKTEPLSALTAAVKMLCDVISLEDESTIAKYRSLILEAVGEEGKLLTSIINNLHLIIGPQPDIFESFGHEATNRFKYVFIKFIKAIASASCPLAIVLEDLQWMDVASIDLIEAMVESSIKNLILVGVYRDNEVQGDHKLVNFFRKVEESNIVYTKIKLNDLNIESINEFVSDALRVPALSSYPLSIFIYKKTEGNPFFVKQIFNALLEQNLIKFSPEQNKWQWDSRIDSARDISENVLDLLKQKILSLEKFGQQAFKIATLLGSPFSISLLTRIINNKKGVEDALATGMITQYNGLDTACFAHDQIQHAASSLLPKDSKPIFLYVAKKLWWILSKADLEENICIVVNLFDRVKDIIDGSERHKVAELFLLAGEKAMNFTAPNEALNYFKSGVELLDKNSWKTHYEITLSIYCNASKSAYCIAHYKAMKKFIDEIFNNAEDVLDLVKPYMLTIRMNNDKRMYDDAIRNALEVLNKLGEGINPNQSVTKSGIIQIKKAVEESFDTILEMKEVEDKKVLSSMEILNCILYSSFFSERRHLLSLVCLKMVSLTMKYGCSKYSCNGILSFAIILCGMGDKSSYELGKLALQLLEKSKAKDMIPTVNRNFFGLVNPFFASIHNSLVPMRRMACISLEIGSHAESSSCFACYFSFSFFCGEPLSKLTDEMNEFEDAFPIRTKMNLAIHQAAINLEGSEIKNPAKLSGEKFDCKFCFHESGVKSDIVRTSTISCVVAYLFYDYQTASSLLKICKTHKECFGNVFLKVIYYLYDGLVASEMAKNAGSKEKSIIIVKGNVLNLKRFAQNAPMNYQNKVHLLEAELAAVCKKKSEAISHYEKAISLSNENGFVNEEAMAYERLGLFYLESKSQSDATKALLNSFYLYKAWGANSKMLHLIERHTFLKDALKASSNTLDKSGEGLQVKSDAFESVSVLTDTSASVYSWQDQKRVRLSIT